MSKRPSLAANMKAVAEQTQPDPAALVAQARSSAALAPHSVQPARVAGERYAGMKRALIPLDPAVHQQLRMLALRQGTTFEKIMQAAAAEYAERHAS